ncbi:MAG: hypothetical protein H6606_02750 [Flavobacteriales bacterium]|nr:hypothetical protein [Flavobacteriales bacterium]
MKPGKVLLALLYLNVFLFFIVLLFGKSEYSITESINLRFVTLHDLFHKKELKVVNVDSVLQYINPIDTSSFAAVLMADTLIPIPEPSKRIQFEANKRFKALERFFKALLELEQGSELIRILHYGDSQLEGDRISDYLRNKLQLRFGGNGPGIILPIDISNSRVSIRQSESPDWKKHAVYGDNRRLKNGLYGIGASSYTFDGKFAVKIAEDTVIQKVYPWADSLNRKGDSAKQPIVQDSGIFVWDTSYVPIYEERTVQQTYLRFRNATRSYPRVRTYSRATLLYGSEKPFGLAVSADSMKKQLTVPAAMPLGKAELHTGTIRRSLTLNFKAEESPIVYGVLLDGDSGIAVDNFPMRGSSGLGFEMIDQNMYSRILKLTNTRLIVMQYGINVVPSPRKNYDFYERMFDAQLKAIRKAAPDMSILVIGPSDMSRKQGGTYVSYPNIPLIRDAMKNAAYKNDCAFWDLYESMGGENSMVAWVENDPPLAAKDFTHFSHRGAQFVGEMLYNALISEYAQWKKLQLKKMKESQMKPILVEP